MREARAGGGDGIEAGPRRRTHVPCTEKSVDEPRFVADVDGGRKGSGAVPSGGSPPTPSSTAAVATGAGIVRPEVLADGTIRVDMGPPILAPARVPTTLPSSAGKKASAAFKDRGGLDAVVAGEVRSGGDTWLVTCVSMGNPHAVTFGTADGAAIEDVDAVDLSSAGAEMVGFFKKSFFVYF